MGFKNQADRERAEDKLACQLGSLVPTGMNEMAGLGDYAKQMYDVSQAWCHDPKTSTT